MFSKLTAMHDVLNLLMSAEFPTCPPMHGFFALAREPKDSLEWRWNRFGNAAAGRQEDRRKRQLAGMIKMKHRRRS
jgi:hypothetical protein